MSRSPYIRGDPFWDFFAQPDRFFDSHFGHTLTEEDFFPPSYYRRVAPRQFGVPRSPMMDSLMHPLAAQQQQQQQQQQSQQVQQQQQQQQHQQVQVQAPPQQGDKYSIMVDVSQFTPEEISVKTIDNTIIVIGKHEDKADNFGYVSRQFSRKYLLPSDVVPETVTSTLSADGILSIQAPRKPLMIKDTEVGRAVPIALSNQCISPAAQHVAPPQFPQPTANVAPTPVPASVPVAQPIPVSVEQSSAPSDPVNEQ